MHLFTNSLFNATISIFKFNFEWEGSVAPPFSASSFLPNRQLRRPAVSHAVMAGSTCSRCCAPGSDRCPVRAKQQVRRRPDAAAASRHAGGTAPARMNTAGRPLAAGAAAAPTADWRRRTKNAPLRRGEAPGRLRPGASGDAARRGRAAARATPAPPPACLRLKRRRRHPRHCLKAQSRDQV